MTLNQLKDGKIWAAWDNFDLLGMLQQLGVIPSGPPGSGDGRPAAARRPRRGPRHSLNVGGRTVLITGASGGLGR